MSFGKQFTQISKYRDRTRQQVDLSMGQDPTRSGRTKQEFADECDINKIVKLAESTGILAHQSLNPPTYGDFTSGESYQSAMNQLIEADQAFAELPSRTRERFGNDPKRLIEFLQDPESREEAVKLGLVKKPEPESPSKPPSPTAPKAEPEVPTPVTGGE